MKKVSVILIFMFVSCYSNLMAQVFPLHFDEEKFDFGTIEIGNTISHNYTFQNNAFKPIKKITLNDSCKCTVSEIDSYTDRPVYSGRGGKIMIEFTPQKVGHVDKIICLNYYFMGHSTPIFLYLSGEVIDIKPSQDIKLAITDRVRVRSLVQPKVTYVNKVNREPIPLNMNEIKSRISYPEIAKGAGIEGEVRLKILVDKNGRYHSHTVLNSDSAPLILLESVEDEVKNLLFSPAIRNDMAVDDWIEIPFIFRVSNGGDFEMKIICQ